MTERPGTTDELEPVLGEQLAYYRAIAGEYEDYAIPGLGGSELTAALESFRPAGRVLELACATGVWPELLLRHATSIRRGRVSRDAGDRVGACRRQPRALHPG